jgi:hypothetical protein
MAESSRENTAHREATDVPRSLAETPPPPSYPHVVDMGYVLQNLMEIQKSVGELNGSVKQTNSRLNTQESNSRTDFWRTISAIAGAVVLLMGALIYGYFKLDDRVVNISTGLTKIETKVDALSQRPTIISPPSVLPQR